MAIQTIAFIGTTPIGGPLLGIVSDATNPRVAIAAGAVSCFVSAVYAAHRLPRRIPPAPTGAVAGLAAPLQPEL